MKKLIILALSLSTISLAALGQRPVVTGISPKSATVKETVTISGTNLPTGTNAQVHFGAAKGTIIEAGSSQIKVEVPAGASFDGITVTNTTDGLSAKSASPFLLSFGGNAFDGNKMGTDEPVTGNFGMFDMCSCDFNGDGKVDVVTSHTNNRSLSAFRYDITAPSPYFSRTSVTLNYYSRNIICGDLDGDGKPDIAISGSGVDAGKVLLLKNIGTVGGSLAFSSPIVLTLPINGAGMLAMQDLNSDGRPDLVITNTTANVVTVFRNASSGGFLQFDNQAQNISIAGPNTTHGLSIQDLDGDGLADLAVTGFYERNVYVLRNTSSGNTIAFGAPATLASTTDALIYLIAADLNGDGKADLAATDNDMGKLMVWLNTSSSGSMQFGSASVFETGSFPWGIAAGDIDGNGKTDLVVSHLQSRSLLVLHNNSTNGSLQLTGTHVNTTEYGRHTNLIDYSGDGKPDLAYTGTSSGNTLRILRNAHCVVPKLSPAGTITLCAGQTLELQASRALQVSYKWTRNGTALAATDNKITISEAGDYAVSITSTVDGCNLQSEVVRVISGSGSGGTVAMEAIAPVCVGGATQLKATAISGATYVWNGPNGFTTTTTTPSHTLSNVQASAAGSYSVVIKSGDCQFTPAAQSLTVHAAPQPTITASATAFCSGTSVTLEAQAGFSLYQWKLNGANYSGAGASTRSITTSTAGKYTIVVTNSSGCSAESAAVTISQTQAPVANFTAPATACLQQPVAFQNTSTFASGQTPAYQWSFGDGQTSTQASPSHTYAATGTYTVNLTVSYGSQSCSNSTSKTISVVASPAVDLVTEQSPIFCPGDSIMLRLEGDIASVLWNTGATTTSIWAKDAGTYAVDVMTNAGCTIQRSIDLSHLEQPVITISASATTINRGESVELVAEGGIQYRWNDAEGLMETWGQTLKIAPLKTTTYILTGWGSNGCYSTAEITIVLDNSLRINPPKVFVPAVDGTWSITDMYLYPDINLTIVNSLGRSIFQASPYTNQWDGTERGRALEAGVYYYIFKDAANKVLKTGSITLLR